MNRREIATQRTALSLLTGVGLVLYRQVQVAGARGIVPLDAARGAAALVLGSPVRRGLTAILADRVATAARLFHQGQVARLVLTGSSAAETGDEVEAMSEAALGAGVPASALDRDPLGRHTFESIENARALAGPLVVVTQRFHLPRALYLCGRMGIDAVGVAADLRPYTGLRDYRLREISSSVLAYWMSR
jgi:vancomycin permeability regulator SanA